MQRPATLRTAIPEHAAPDSDGPGPTPARSRVDGPDLSRRVVAAVLGLLMVAAGGGALFVSRNLFPLYSINHDETMYVFLGQAIEHGDLTPVTPDAEAVRPWGSRVVDDGRIVVIYDPPWPAALAVADRLLGSMRAGLAVTAAATILFAALLGREVFRRWRPALFGAGVLAASPFLVIQSATFLPYVFELLLTALFGFLVLSGLRLGSRWRLLVAGFVLGVAFFHRPYDAVLLGLPFAVGIVAVGWRRWARLAGQLTAMALGAAGPLAAMLLYNAHTMGDPLEMPFSLTGPQNVPGFGMRGIHELTTFKFELADGLSSTAQNLGWFVRWQFGGILLLPLLVIGIWWSRGTNPLRWAVVGIVATYLVGYTAFWSPWAIVYSWPGARTLGPFYILPLLLPVAVLAGAGLDAIVTRHRLLAVGTVVALVGATLLGLPDKIDANRNTTELYRRTAAVVDDANLTNAIVIDPERGDFGFVSAAPSLENRPTFDGPVVWADDVAGGIFDLLAAYPGRAPYRLDHVLPSGQPHALRTPLLVPQTVDEGPGLDVHLRFTSPVAGAGLTSFVHVGPVDRFIGMAESAKVGASYDVTFHLTPSSFGSEDTVTLGAADREGVIAFGVEVVTDRTERYEWRVPYRVSPNRVEIALPGAPWRLWAGTTPAVWLEEDVRPVLSLFSSAPVTAGVAGRR